MRDATANTTPHPTLVRLYTRLYRARFGSVIQPHPRGALIPKECRTARFNEVRAAKRFFNDGTRSPNLTEVASTAQVFKSRIGRKPSSAPPQATPPPVRFFLPRCESH